MGEIKAPMVEGGRSDTSPGGSHYGRGIRMSVPDILDASQPMNVISYATGTHD